MEGMSPEEYNYHEAVRTAMESNPKFKDFISLVRSRMRLSTATMMLEAMAHMCYLDDAPVAEAAELIIRTAFEAETDALARETKH